MGMNLREVLSDARDWEIQRLTERLEVAADGLRERDAEIERLKVDREQGGKDYLALMDRHDRQHVLIERLKELLGAARDDMADIVSKIDAALAGKEGKT